MDSLTLLQHLTSMLKTGLLVVSPLIVLILVVGMLVSVIQVVTQIQDASIAFVPKLLIAGVSLVLVGPWMMKRIATFAVEMISRVSGAGG